MLRGLEAKGDVMRVSRARERDALDVVEAAVGEVFMSRCSRSSADVVIVVNRHRKKMVASAQPGAMALSVRLAEQGSRSHTQARRRGMPAMTTLATFAAHS